MRLLVDANALIWAVDQPSNLGAKAAAALNDPANQLLISAATIWEIAIKVGLRKLVLTFTFRRWMNQAINDLGISVLPVTIDYAEAQIALPLHHRDPFDRLLIAQALVEQIAIISSDAMLDRYGISRIWA
jgi:PIN domain nuclease of toxin-antitoxin system